MKKIYESPVMGMLEVVEDIIAASGLSCEEYGASNEIDFGSLFM